MLPDDCLRVLRTLLDEIEEEAEFEARYGMPPSLSINGQNAVTYDGGTAGEHWPKRPAHDNALGSDRLEESVVEVTRQQSSDVAK